MKVLVTTSSGSTSTAASAARVGATLRRRGHEVAVLPAAQLGSLAGYDAIALGGALYPTLPLRRWADHVGAQADLPGALETLIAAGALEPTPLPV